MRASRILYLLVFFTSLTSYGQLLNPYFYGDAYTNGNGQQAVLLIGDSMISYSGDNTAGPTPAANTVFEFDGANVIQVTNGYLANSGNAGAGLGDPWPRCGIDYYALTGKKLVFVDCHKYNSTLYKATSSAVLNWIYSTSWTKDGLYTSMKTKADAALLAVGVQRFRGIIINICTNDSNSADILADVLTAYNKLIEYLQADFPNTPIYIITPANLTSSTTQTARVADIRYHIMTRDDAYDNVHIAYNANYGMSLGYLNAGAPHMDQAFNNAQGASMALYMTDTEQDRDVRRITNMFFTPISASKRAAWKTAILALKSAGLWDKIDYLLAPKADNYENLTMEIIGMASPYNVVGGWTFSSGYVNTNGSSTYQQLFFVPSLHLKKGSLNDMLVLNKVITNSTPAGTLGCLFGTTASYIATQLANSTVRFQCNDNTNSDSALETKFQNNTWYGVARSSSTNKDFIKNSSVLYSATVTSTSLSTGRQSRGCQGIGVSQFINATHGAHCISQYSGFDIATFESIMDTLEAAF